MSIFYIQAELEGEVIQFALDSTSSVTETLSGNATSFPIESGSDVSDHYVNKNNIITMSGRISDVKSVQSGFLSENQEGTRQVQDSVSVGSATRYGKTKDYIEKIKLLKAQKVPFDVYTSSDIYTNCVFQSLTITQNDTAGVSSNNISAYRISFSAKQLRFAKATTSVVVRDEVLAPDSTVGFESPAKSQVKELTPKEREEVDTILRRSTFGFGPV